MRTPTLPPLAAPAPPARTGAGVRGVLAALALVVGFWWLATGLIVAFQRDPLTRVLAFYTANALALAGVWLLRAARGHRTPASARRSLVGGALLWAWVSVMFYGGWIVGPGTPAPAAHAAPSLALALRVIHATWHNEAAAIGSIVAAWWLTRGAPNRVGLYAVLAFWTTHQIAKLNLFFGVVNPAKRFLPSELEWIAGYFGPERNSALLPLSVAVLGIATVWLAHGATRASDPFRRQTAALLAVLIGLAALEHLLLGVAWDAPLWEVFLRARGGG